MSENETLNSGDSSASEVVSGDFLDVGDGLISSVDRAIPSSPGDLLSDEKAAAPSGEDAKTTAEDSGKNAEASKEPPFHEHPRWQELMREREAQAREIAELRGKMSMLPAEREQSGRSKESEDRPVDYVDLSTFNDDQLAEMLVSKPKEMIGNIVRQTYAETRRAVLEELSRDRQRTSQEQVLQRTYEDYSKKYPDFDDMWKAGSIQNFMRDNPGHNAMSAHQVLRAENAEKDLAKRIEDVRKETEQKILADMKAKQGARVLSGAPVSGAGQASRKVPDELKNPAKYGGAISVLAARLAARRSHPG